MDNLKDFRPVPFYFLNTTDPDDYTDDAVNRAMQKMQDLGYGGIVLFNKPPSGFDAAGYLSETWFDLTGKFICAARKSDMQLWINDGFNYPPGDAGGRIAAIAPELKQLRLIPNTAGKLDIREADWGFPAFEEPRSSELFIKFVYEEYYRRFAPFFGNGITGFFSDADNRRFNAATCKLCAERYYPWSRNFSNMFKQRFNYHIEERLKGVFDNSDAQAAHDYWLLCGELYQQWFSNNYRWCRKHGVLYTFHTSDTGPLNYENCKRSSAFTEGDPLALAACADYPGTDHELMVLDGGTHYDDRFFTPRVSLGGGGEFLEHPNLNDTSLDLRAKYASSTAFLYKKKRVMCEMFAATNWSADFNDLSRIAVWQIMQGINFIVPHAVHHRFSGETKFFAPPEFSHTTSQYGLRQFNDQLARWCQAASAGEYLAEYAVVDPTRAVWQGQKSDSFFRLCDQLNRRADGYVIVPQDYSGDIKNVIDPLISIPELPPPEITFTGGEVAFMRRKLQGEVYLLAANVWSCETLAGVLTFAGKKYEILLAPGEIAVIGGPFESYRTPEKTFCKHRFSGNFPVHFQNSNILPFDKKITFTLTAAMSLEILVPAENSGTVTLGDKKLLCDVNKKVFDDQYSSCIVELASGTHTLELETAAAFHTPGLLRGNFDLDICTHGDFSTRVFQFYQLTLYAPEDKTVVLSPRRTLLATDKGWEQQGQVFYSGMAEIDLGTIETANGDKLILPGFSGCAELIVNGKSAGRQALTPYCFELPPGKTALQLRLWNTMANRLERFAAPAGLSAPPEIVNN